MSEREREYEGEGERIFSKVFVFDNELTNNNKVY